MGFTDVAWESRSTEQLARDLTEGPGPASVGGAGAAQLHEAIALLLEAASRERPVVVVIEDLHWIDGASLAAMQFSMRALTAGRLSELFGASQYRTDAFIRPSRGGGQTRCRKLTWATL